MCAVIVASGPGRSETAIKEAGSPGQKAQGKMDRVSLPSCVLSPVAVGQLFLNQLLQVDPFIELVRLRTGVADKPFRIECLRDLR